MIQNYFSMSHTNDVINSGFKREVQKPKINDIFCPGYFFLLSLQNWLQGVIIQAHTCLFFTEWYRKVRKLSICWNYRINDIFSIKRVNLSVFRSEYYWLNNASAYFFLFSFLSHVTRKSGQLKSSYKLWNHDFEFLNFHMTCYISYDSVYSVEPKNMHFIEIRWLWSKLRLFFALSGQNHQIRQKSQKVLMIC